MLKVERSLMWTHVSITGVDIDHQLASGIAVALGLIMREDEERSDLDPACKFDYDLLDSNGDYYGSFSFDTDIQKWPTISLYIDFGSKQESKYNTLGGESWLQNLLEKSVDKFYKN